MLHNFSVYFAGKEQSSKERSMALECTIQQNQQEIDQRNSNKTCVRERIESRIPSLHNNRNNLNQNNTAIGNTNDIQNYKVWQNQTSNSNQSTSYHDNSILMQSQNNSQNEQRYANYNPGNYSSSEQQLQSHDPLPSTSGYYSNNISEQTFYRWKKKYGDMELADAKRLKELEKENVELKKMLAEAMLENRVLKEVNSKKW